MKIISSATRRLLSPVAFAKNDRLRIGISKEGTRFVVTPYAVNTSPAVIAGDTEKIVGNIRDLERIIQEMGGSTQVHIETRENRVHSSWKASREWFNRVPERKQVDLGGTFPSWELAATDFTVCVIDALWPREQIVFEDEEAQARYDYILLTAAKLDKNAEAVAGFKENKAVPLSTRALVLHSERPLADYQLIGLHNSMGSEGFALFMEQGTGKTPIVIARVCNECGSIYKTENRLYRVLIVCPKNVRLNWVSEFERFKTCSGSATAIRGGPVRRFKALINAIANPGPSDKFTVAVVSYETATRMKELLTIKWDLVVGDESHFFKSMNADRTKAMHQLRDVASARMALSGTPITNTHFDLFAQFEFLGKGWSGFNSYHNFRNFYGVFKTTGEGYEKLIATQNLPFIRERLARQAYMISKEEALPNLPAKMYDIQEVEMSTRQAEIYDALRKQLIVEIENELESETNKQLVANHVLTKLLRLAQITSGFVVWSNSTDPDTAPKREVERLHPSPKIDALVEMLKEKGPLEKSIVWCCWVPDIVDIKARLDVEGIDSVTFYGQTKDEDREEAMRRFNCDPDCRVIIGNAAAGGTGTNLRGYDLDNQDTCKTNVTQVFYFSQNWSPTARAQSEDRCHGKDRCRVPIRYTDLVAPGTIDEEIRIRVLAKKKMALEISDIRSILRNVLHGVTDDNN